jgi:hypothetical protein
LRTVGCDPFDPQFVQRSPELRSQRISPELFGKWLRASLLKTMLVCPIIRVIARLVVRDDPLPGLPRPVGNALQPVANTQNAPDWIGAFSQSSG